MSRPLTHEEASELGRRGGQIAQANRRKREQLAQEAAEAASKRVEDLPGDSVEEKAMALLENETVALTALLLDAANGRNGWEKLSKDKQLAALTRCMDYIIGKPTAKRDDGVGRSTGGGLTFGVADGETDNS